MFSCVSPSQSPLLFSFFFFNDTATTEIYTLSLHDALPIYHLVELHEVDGVGLEPAQGLIDLLRRRLPVATVDLGHEKHVVAIAVAQRLSHADFARPTVVVPAVVEEVDPVVDGRADDADGFLLVSLPPEVVAAHADQRHHLSGAPKATVGNPVARSHGRHAHRFRMPCASRQATPTTQGKSLHRRAFGGTTVTRGRAAPARSEEHTSELQSPCNLVCRLLLEKKKTQQRHRRRPSIEH